MINRRKSRMYFIKIRNLPLSRLQINERSLSLKIRRRRRKKNRNNISFYQRRRCNARIIEGNIHGPVTRGASMI